MTQLDRHVGRCELAISVWTAARLNRLCMKRHWWPKLGYMFFSCVNFLIFKKISWSQIISGSTGPIFTLCSPNGRYLFVDDRSGPHFAIPHGRSCRPSALSRVSRSLSPPPSSWPWRLPARRRRLSDGGVGCATLTFALTLTLEGVELVVVGGGCRESSDGVVAGRHQLFGLRVLLQVVKVVVDVVPPPLVMRRTAAAAAAHARRRRTVRCCLLKQPQSQSCPTHNRHVLYIWMNQHSVVVDL